MSVQSNRDHAISQWLREEAEGRAPDRLIEAVRSELDVTHQRRVPWPARRFTPLHASLRPPLTAAAAVAAVAVVAVLLWPRPTGVSAPGAASTATAATSPSPSASPSRNPSQAVQALSAGPLKAGPVLAEALGPRGATSVTFTVPDGWRGFAANCVLPVTGTVAPDGMGICFSHITTGLFSDPCHGSTSPADVPVGPTVDDLATALGAQTAYTSTKPVDVTLGGASGKRMDLRLPSDVASCTNGEFYPWSGSIYAQGPNNHWRLWILDVAGDRLIVIATDFPATPAADVAEQQAIVDSMQFQRR